MKKLWSDVMEQELKELTTQKALGKLSDTEEWYYNMAKETSRLLINPRSPGDIVAEFKLYRKAWKALKKFNRRTGRSK